MKAVLRRFAHLYGFGQLAVMVGGMSGDLRMRVKRLTNACKETYESSDVKETSSADRSAESVLQ